MDTEAKAKLALKLSGALHQAPDHPEAFASVLQQQIRANGLHITDLEISIGDSARRMGQLLKDARRIAQPTFSNLLDLATTKLNVGRGVERAIADAVGVSVKTVQEQKKMGRVPRMWLQKIEALPDLDETTVQLDTELKKVVLILAEKGYSPDAIYDVFCRVRTTRAGARQIATVVHGSRSALAAFNLDHVRDQLFGNNGDGRRRLQVWLETHLRTDVADNDNLLRGMNPKNVEKLQIRFERELRMRRTDAAYAGIAIAAELINRPRRGNRARSNGTTPTSHELSERLKCIFGNDGADRLAVRLAQLTGLDERHTQDLLKGADAVTASWWAFLDDVEKELAISFRERHASATQAETEAPASVGAKTQLDFNSKLAGQPLAPEVPIDGARGGGSVLAK